MDDMRVTSVNVGREETIDHGNRRFRTGIRKRSVDGAVYIGSDSVAGDTISDKKHHGGADQVVYAYSADDYEWWSEQLGHELAPGTFGENLTIEGGVIPPTRGNFTNGSHLFLLFSFKYGFYGNYSLERSKALFTEIRDWSLEIGNLYSISNL